MLTARDDLRVFAVALDSEDIARVSEDLVGLGIEIGREELVRTEYTRPFDHFGAERGADGDGDYFYTLTHFEKYGIFDQDGGP